MATIATSVSASSISGITMVHQGRAVLAIQADALAALAKLRAGHGGSRSGLLTRRGTR